MCVHGGVRAHTHTHTPYIIHAQLPSADDVKYWDKPDKAGWLQSQAEHLKTWRKRWFVLKQGYLFRCVCYALVFLVGDVRELWPFLMALPVVVSLL